VVLPLRRLGMPALVELDSIDALVVHMQPGVYFTLPDGRVWVNERLPLHLHDSDGTRNHLPLFDGSLDIARYLGLAEERQASVVIETKTADAIRASVARLRERGLLG
jgi:hypothetical protein